jgi:hypothetical protein
MQKLSPDMPLQLASETLLRMFRARVHHHRQGQVLSHFSFPDRIFPNLGDYILSNWGEGGT